VQGEQFFQFVSGFLMLFSESIFTLARPAKGNEHVQTTEHKREKEKDTYTHTHTHTHSRDFKGGWGEGKEI
jgi:hypothetical protein